MITAFHEANRVDLIDELQCIVTHEYIPIYQPPTQSASHDLDWYGSYLKKQYLEVLFTLQVSANKWLPSPTQKIFNLAIIKKEKIQRGKIDDDFIHKTIRGQVDDILQKKSPIKLKDLFKNIEGKRKVILIDGAPGSGKSTLTVHICQQWGRGELFNEFTVVILVQLRDPKVQSAQSITDLLPAEDDTMAERAAREITANKRSGVLWILDGYDELPSDLHNDSIVSTLINPKLHQKNLLSKTAVIVTSRPISSDDLFPVVSSRIEVLGFTAEEQRLFFTECLKNDTNAVETLMERLSNNPAMEGSCYLPLNASIVAHLYLTDGSLPSTIYDIFFSLVQHSISRYLHERLGIPQKVASFKSLDGLPDDLHLFFEQLCKLAFRGTRDNKVTFSSSDIVALGCSDEICEVGLLQAVVSIVSHGRSVYYNFLHLSIQEMLAAVHISRMPAGEQISTFGSMFNDARFSAVLQFYAAITKLRTSRPLLSLVPRFLRPVPASIYDLIRKIIRKDSDALLVSLMNCLYEAQDTALCKYVGEQLKDYIYLPNLFGQDIKLFYFGSYFRLHVSLSPQDCLSIGYFLASIAVSYKGEFNVWLTSCFLRDTGIKILMQSLYRSLDSHSETTGHLNMDISNNWITGEGASYIAEALRTTRALRMLDLYGNPIGDKGLQYIAEALTTNTSLIELRLRACSVRITEENGPILTELLQRNKALRKVNLSGNKISGNGLQYIAEALTTNTSLLELNLSWCSLRITEENGPTLTKMLQKNKSLRVLNLSGVRAISVSFIIEGLKKNTTLKTLNLHSCSIIDEGICCSITDEGICLIRKSTSTCKIIQ